MQPEVVSQLHPGVPSGLGVLALSVELGGNSAVRKQDAGVVRFGRHLRSDLVECPRKSELGFISVELL